MKFYQLLKESIYILNGRKITVIQTIPLNTILPPAVSYYCTLFIATDKGTISANSTLKEFTFGNLFKEGFGKKVIALKANEFCPSELAIGFVGGIITYWDYIVIILIYFSVIKKNRLVLKERS